MNMLILIEKIRETANADKVVYAEDINKLLAGTTYSKSLKSVADELLRHGYSVNYASRDKGDK